MEPPGAILEPPGAILEPPRSDFGAPGDHFETISKQCWTFRDLGPFAMLWEPFSLLGTILDPPGIIFLWLEISKPRSNQATKLTQPTKPLSPRHQASKPLSHLASELRVASAGCAKGKQLPLNALQLAEKHAQMRAPRRLLDALG